MYLQGSIEQVSVAYDELVELSINIGLQVQPAKCAVYRTDSDAARVFAEHLGVRFVPSEEGILVAGMPVGSDAFAKKHADEIGQDYARHRYTAGATRQCAKLLPATAQVPAAADSTLSSLCGMETG